MGCIECDYNFRQSPGVGHKIHVGRNIEMAKNLGVARSQVGVGAQAQVRVWEQVYVEFSV